MLHLTLREVHTVKIAENMELRRLHKSEEEEVTGGS
jgi:hypothetical protein